MKIINRLRYRLYGQKEKHMSLNKEATKYKRQLQETTIGKNQIKFFDLIVTNLWNNSSFTRESLNYIGSELVRRVKEE